MSRSLTQKLGWVFVLAAAGLCGCTLPNFGKQPVKTDGPPPPQCTVEFKPVSGKSSTSQLNISEDATVQQVAAQSGAMRKYRRMNLDLYRQQPNGEWHKMGVKYDVTKRRVDPLHDYHVQAGDRLVVSEDGSDMFDDMFSSKLSPFGSK
jgi:hypothetical protein